MPLDPTPVLRAVADVFNSATPDVVGELLLTQLPFLDEAAAGSLADALLGSLPVEAWGWQVTDATLDRWAPSIADRVVAEGKARLNGSDWVELVCHTPRRATEAERRAALDGVLDNTFATSLGQIDRSEEVAAFVQVLPGAWQEEWIAERAMRFGPDSLIREEVRARELVDRWPEPEVRALWTRIAAASDLDVARLSVGLTPHVPDDLRALALARIRACPDPSDRYFNLVHLDAELTAEERIALVRGPPSLSAYVIPSHLHKVRPHLARVPITERLRWLSVLQGLDDPFRRLGGLQALEPHLEGTARSEAVEAMVALATEQGSWSWSPDRWDLIPEAGIPALVERLVRKDASGWNRDALVDHILHRRSAEVAERALLPVIRSLRRLRADRRLEAVTALTPWLAERTGGACARGVAGLDVPVPRRKADRWRREKRMLRGG